MSSDGTSLTAVLIASTPEQPELSWDLGFVPVDGVTAPVVVQTRMEDPGNPAAQPLSPAPSFRGRLRRPPTERDPVPTPATPLALRVHHPRMSATTPERRLTVSDITRMHADGQRIPMLTAYDYPTAQIVDEAGIPMILVGDSLGEVMLGYESTVRVTIDEMLHHTKAVVRGTKRALVVGDMPFLTYATVDEALENAGRFMREAGTGAVKVEGGVRSARIIETLVRAGIPVMGHIGWTPQAKYGMGGKTRVQGKDRDQARSMLADALAVQEAGAFAIVLELMPDQLAAAITERLRIPTIGIGAGVHCSGQVQVITDLLGLGSFIPRHARPYAHLRETIAEAARRLRGRRRRRASSRVPSSRPAWTSRCWPTRWAPGRSIVPGTDDLVSIPLDRDL